MGKENLNLKLSFLTQAKKIIENPIIGRPQSKLAKYNKIENSIKAHEFFVTGMLLLLESQEKIILMETIENFFVQAANLAQEDEKLSFQIGDFGFCGIEEILTKKMEDLAKSINNNPSKISDAKIKWDTLRSERIKYNQKAIEHFTKKNYNNKYLSMLIYARMGCCYERIGIVFSIETLASVEQKNDRKDMETAFKKSIECFLNALSVCDQLQKEGNNIDPTNIFFNKAFAHEHIAVILHKYNFSLNEVLQHLKAASQTQLECILECAKRKNQTHIDYWNNFKRFHEHLKSFLSNEDENWKKKQLFDSYNFIVSSAEQVLAINPKDLNAKKMLDFWK